MKILILLRRIYIVFTTVVLQKIICFVFQGTISQYFATSNCPICDSQTKQPVCHNCMNNPQLVCVTLNERISHWERAHKHLQQVAWQRSLKSFSFGETSDEKLYWEYNPCLKSVLIDVLQLTSCLLSAPHCFLSWI